MTEKQFITKAIEGGYRSKGYCSDWKKPIVISVTRTRVCIYNGLRKNYWSLHEIFLSKEAWQAVGKVEGWDKKIELCIHEHAECADDTRPEWLDKMHSMIDALAEGKSIKEYLKTL